MNTVGNEKKFLTKNGKKGVDIMNRVKIMFSAVVIIVLSVNVVLAAAPAVGKAESKTKTKTIDTSKDGTYISGKWKYVFTITAKGTKSQGCRGDLYYDGKKLFATKVVDIRKTPWGEMVWVGESPLLWEPKGWMPKHENIKKTKYKSLKDL
jgi:hypothetical protein